MICKSSPQFQREVITEGFGKNYAIIKSDSLTRSHVMGEFKIAAIPGDGIGKEVVAAGLEILEALARRDGGFRLKVESLDWSN